MPELDSDEDFPLMQGIAGMDEDRLEQLKDWIIDRPRIQAIEDDVCPICLMEIPIAVFNVGIHFMDDVYFKTSNSRLQECLMDGLNLQSAEET